MTDYLTARERPIGIIILSILHSLGGVALAISLVAIAYIRDDPRATEALDALGIPLPLLLVGIGFLAVLAIASAIGMWLGKAWGWYLGSFWYAYAIVRNLNAIFAVFNLSAVLPAEDMAQMSRGPGYYYIKFGGRIVVSLLIYLYFFKTNVREYFGLTTTRWWKPAVAEFAICAVIVVAISALAELMR